MHADGPGLFIDYQPFLSAHWPRNHEKFIGLFFKIRILPVRK